MHDRAIWAKKLIDFVNSKSDQELGEHEIKDRNLCVIYINKVIVKNAQRKSVEKKLTEIKQVVDNFNTIFDKRTRVGLSSCWDLKCNLFSQETYETMLVDEKSKIDNTHERVAVLKGTTIVNFLHKDFQLLWMVKNLFLEKPTYTRINAFRLEHHQIVHPPKTNFELQIKCRAWMFDLPEDTSTTDGTQKTTLATKDTQKTT